MHESTQVTEDLRDALEAALAAGTSREEIQDMLHTIPQLTLSEPPYPDVVQVYHDDLPEGLIDVPSAAKKYERSRQAIHQWIANGLLSPVGLFNRRGVSASKVVREADLAALLNGLRPGSIPVFSELPPGSIEIRSASNKYDVPLSTIWSWVKEGYVPLTGKLKTPGVHRKPLAVVCESTFVAHATKRGKSVVK